MDTEWYEYAEYTTGRKQDYGHHEYNSENGWLCYDWDRGDYTETMQMKRPLSGKGWKPYRAFTGAGRFEDFTSMEEAILWANKNPYYAGITGPHTPTIREVDIDTGEVIPESPTQQSIKE